MYWIHSADRTITRDFSGTLRMLLSLTRHFFVQVFIRTPTDTASIDSQDWIYIAVVSVGKKNKFLSDALKNNSDVGGTTWKFKYTSIELRQPDNMFYVYKCYAFLNHKRNITECLPRGKRKIFYQNIFLTAFLLALYNDHLSFWKMSLWYHLRFQKAFWG